MGSPKALLDFRGETFLDRMIRVYGMVCGGPVIAVLGHHAETVARGIGRARDAMLVLNARPEDGQLSSLQAGLRAARQSTGWILFAPVDSPAVAEITLAKIIAACHGAGSKTLLAIPRCSDRRGHPVALRAELAEPLLVMDPRTQSARDFVHAHREETLYVDVDDDSITWDIDSPEAYTALVGALR